MIIGKLKYLASFNPLPAVKLGDTQLFVKVHQDSLSFNPLPAVKLGDTGTNAPSLNRLLVSIRSQRLSWEIRCCFMSTPTTSSFNPLPAVKLGDTVENAHNQ